MHTVLVVPFGQPDIETGRVDIAQADDARFAVAEARRAGDHNGVGEGRGQGNPDPVTADHDFAGFHLHFCRRYFGHGGNSHAGIAFCALIVRHLEGGGKGGLGGVGVADRLAGS